MLFVEIGTALSKYTQIHIYIQGDKESSKCLSVFSQVRRRGRRREHRALHRSPLADGVPVISWVVMVFLAVRCFDEDRVVRIHIDHKHYE